MYTVKILTHFAAAHALRNYQGECERLHGHNWDVEVTAAGETIDKHTGMLMDFKTLKKITNAVIKPFDHQYLNEIAPFDVINPTAENIARHIYEQIGRQIQQPSVLKSVTIWETKTASATYTA